MIDLIACPECDEAASVLDRFSLDSTDGPVEHVRTHCVNNHYLTARRSVAATGGAPSETRRARL